MCVNELSRIVGGVASAVEGGTRSSKRWASSTTRGREKFCCSGSGAEDCDREGLIGGSDGCCCDCETAAAAPVAAVSPTRPEHELFEAEDADGRAEAETASPLVLLAAFEISAA